MKISVIGCGYLGAVHAACLASLGHDVIGIDTDAGRVAALRRGRAPFYEPGLDRLLATEAAAGRLRFSTDIGQAADATLHYLGVGTPQSAGSGAADMTYLDAAVESLIEVLPATGHPVVIAGKSTVPVGTATRIAARIAQSAVAACLVWNPEFLREGTAIEDTLNPDRMVYGLPPDPEAAADALRVLDQVFVTGGEQPHWPVVHTDYATAELVKVAANAFLATKVSFINAMARLADASGGDVSELATAIGFDDRIGSKFLRAGVGYGGGCLPKDVRALIARAEELGESATVGFLREVDQLNSDQRDRVLAQAIDMLGGHAPGARVAVLGASFKPGSDDLRDSPALAVATALASAGARVRITDPQASDAVRSAHPELEAAGSAAETLAGADLVVLATEWPEYVALDPAQAGHWVQHRRILDGRNALDSHRWKAAGWQYRGVGRR
ncbi:MAG: UDP-glucose dehydrogenase family protein [Beutenbergiaceae bacterium]